MKRNATGFTLIELLVVMALLSVIMVAMGAALRSMAQTENRIDEKLKRADQMRVVNQFLNTVLGRVDALKVNTLPQGAHLLFKADASSINWVGIMPARHGAGGRYFFRLSTEETPQGSALVLRYAPWSLKNEFPAWPQAESHTLVANLKHLQIEAQGLPPQAPLPPNWPRDWTPGWPIADNLPQRIRLTLTDTQGAWPPLVIPLLATLQSLPGSGDFVAGGSTR